MKKIIIIVCIVLVLSLTCGLVAGQVKITKMQIAMDEAESFNMVQSEEIKQLRQQLRVTKTSDAQKIGNENFEGQARVDMFPQIKLKLPAENFDAANRVVLKLDSREKELFVPVGWKFSEVNGILKWEQAEKIILVVPESISGFKADAGAVEVKQKGFSFIGMGLSKDSLISIARESERPAVSFVIAGTLFNQQFFLPWGKVLGPSGGYTKSDSIGLSEFTAGDWKFLASESHAINAESAMKEAVTYAESIWGPTQEVDKVWPVWQQRPGLYFIISSKIQDVYGYVLQTDAGFCIIMTEQEQLAHLLALSFKE